MPKEVSVADESSSEALIEKFLYAEFERAWFEFDLAMREIVGRENPIQGVGR